MLQFPVCSVLHPFTLSKSVTALRYSTGATKLCTLYSIRVIALHVLLSVTGDFQHQLLMYTGIMSKEAGRTNENTQAAK